MSLSNLFLRKFRKFLVLYLGCGCVTFNWAIPEKNQIGEGGWGYGISSDIEQIASEICKG